MSPTNIDVQYRGSRVHPAIEATIRDSLKEASKGFDLLRSMKVIVDLSNDKKTRVMITVVIGEDESQEFHASGRGAKETVDCAVTKLIGWLNSQKPESATKRHSRRDSKKRLRAIAAVCILVPIFFGVIRLISMPAAGLQLVPAEGYVFRNGSPLPHVSISAFPIGDGGMNAIGYTDDAGRFVLHTRSQVGAMPGDYRVCLSKYVLPDGSEYAADSGISPMEAGVIESIPYRYSDLRDSELTLTIASPESSSLILKIGD